MRKKLIFATLLFFVFSFSGFGQDRPRLASDESQIKNLLQAQRKPTGTHTMGGGSDQPAPPTPVCSPTNLGSFTYPVLKVNRRAFKQGQTLQAWLQLPYYPTSQGDTPCEVYYSWYMQSIDSQQPSNVKIGYVDGNRLMRSGDVVQLMNYTWTLEPAGQYLLSYFCQDANTGGLIAMGTTTITYNWNWQMNFIGIDSAEFQPGAGKILLKGRFFPDIQTPFGNNNFIRQYVEIDGVLFSLKNVTSSTAEIDWYNYWGNGPSPNIYDLTLIAWASPNIAFDSQSAPGVLTVR